MAGEGRVSLFRAPRETEDRSRSVDPARHGLPLVAGAGVGHILWPAPGRPFVTRSSAETEALLSRQGSPGAARRFAGANVEASSGARQNQHRSSAGDTRCDGEAHAHTCSGATASPARKVLRDLAGVM